MTDAKNRLRALVKQDKKDVSFRKTPNERTLSLHDRIEKSKISLTKRIGSEPAETDLSVYVLADRTASMYNTIEIVRDSVNEIAREIFARGKNTGIAVWGLEDHYSSSRTQHLGIDKNPLVDNTLDLERQLKSLNKPADSNDDLEENYECAWFEVSKEISSKPKKGKVAVITFMETAAHSQVSSRYGDNGCPFGISWKAALSLAKAVSDCFFIVDCDGDTGHWPEYKYAKRQCVDPKTKNEYLVEIGNAVNIIPDLLCAMIEKTRSQASYQQLMEHLERKDPRAHQKIAGYLGS